MTKHHGGATLKSTSTDLSNIPGSTFLRGESVTLRVVDEDDLAFAQSVVNHPQVRRGVGVFGPKTKEDEREWYESQDEDGPSFIVYAEADPVGIAGLHVDPYPWRYAEVGYMVHPDHWGNGYATDAVRCLVGYAFDERRLNEVGADVYAPNEGSQRVLEKVGFEREAVRRDHAFVEGEHVDLYEYGLLADEWRERPWFDGAPLVGEVLPIPGAERVVWPTRRPSAGRCSRPDS